jgi:hypothetical protein
MDRQQARTRPNAAEACQEALQRRVLEQGGWAARTCPARRIPLKVPCALVILLLALFSCLPSARCEVSVKGTVAAARIDAQHAPLSEVLRALEKNFKVRYDTFISIDEVTISRSYSGALEEVLRGMLSGLNYVIKTREGTVEVLIVGRSSEAPLAPPVSHVPASGVWDPLAALKAKSQPQTPPQTGEELRK